MPYSIEYTEHASEDIAYFKKYERVIIRLHQDSF